VQWAVAGIIVIVVWTLYAVWRSPSRDSYATYGAFAVAVVVIIPGMLAWARRKSTDSVENPEVFNRRIVDDLAVAARTQWERAAGERGLTGAEPIAVSWASPSVAVAGPAAAAISSRRFTPLPGLPPAGAAQLESGRVSDLHGLYGGLGSGRLIITGAPGSGKSSAAVLLTLATLLYRDQARAEDRAKIPIPVLVTAQDWDPAHEPIAIWLARQMHVIYEQLPALAEPGIIGALMAEGRIALIIDGFDEMTAEMRPIAMRALNQQASCRTILLSRVDEMATAAASQGGLQGAAAIELRPVNRADAVSYLERVQLDPPPEGWRDLLQHLRDGPASPLSAALNNPLSLSLVRDTCRSEQDARELLALTAALGEEFPAQSAEAINGYLLDRVLPAAYTCQPGQVPPPYDLATAQNTLTKIAAQMNRGGTRELYWWKIPMWAPRAQRVVISGLTIGLANGLAAGLTLGLWTGLRPGIIAGLIVGPATGIGVGLSTMVGGDPPTKTTRLRVRGALSQRKLIVEVVAGISVAVPATIVDGIGFGLGLGIAITIVLGIINAATDDPDRSISQSPASSWRSNRNYMLLMLLVGGLVGGLAVGVGSGVVIGFTRGLEFGLTFGVAVGAMGGLMAGLMTTETWPSLIASFQIAIKWRTPMHLIRFLEDAHSRDVFRTVGPAYQFRHARLQDRLAAAPSLDVSTIPPPAGSRDSS
jgi:hypothetical protein